VRKRALRVGQGAAANGFLSLARDQQPVFFGAANEATDFAGKLAVTQFAPAAAVPALQGQILPRQTKLLVNLRKPPRLFAATLARRRPRHIIHAAEDAAQGTL